MRTVPFPASPAASFTELGFGCAAVGGRVGRRESLTALHTAYDAGIAFYDTARSYGYGQSEAILGEFLAGRRESVVVCTKFGILPAASGGWKRRLKPLAQAAIRMFPQLRQAARRQAADQFVGNQFTPATLRTSFETSLRALKTGYVDMLLLHAAPASALEQDDLLEALSQLVERGQVRMAGISAELPTIERYFAERPQPLRTAQFALNAAGMGFAATSARHADLLLVANHPFGGPGGAAAGKETLARLRSLPRLAETLREKLDPADPQAWPELLLNAILRGTGVSAVIPAMMSKRHIESNIAAVERCRFTEEELATLRLCLAATGT